MYPFNFIQVVLVSVLSGALCLLISVSVLSGALCMLIAVSVLSGALCLLISLSVCVQWSFMPVDIFKCLC